MPIFSSRPSGRPANYIIFFIVKRKVPTARPEMRSCFSRPGQRAVQKNAYFEKFYHFIDSDCVESARSIAFERLVDLRRARRRSATATAGRPAQAAAAHPRRTRPGRPRARATGRAVLEIFFARAPPGGAVRYISKRARAAGRFIFSLRS